MIILETRNLKKNYGNKHNEVKALKGVDLTIKKGEFVAVVGTSGSGKSTLLHLMGGLDDVTSGKVYINDVDITTLTPDETTIFRRRQIGFVFQNYNLIPILNVKENITLPIELDRKSIDESHVSNLMETLGIKEKAQCLPHELSGGQQQRVAIARALATKPSILLADEPTGNLDSKTSMEVLGLLKLSSEKYNQTIVMITHNEDIAQLADRIIRLEDGLIMGGQS